MIKGYFGIIAKRNQGKLHEKIEFNYDSKIRQNIQLHEHTLRSNELQFSCRKYLL